MAERLETCPGCRLPVAEGRLFERGRCPVCGTRLAGLPGPSAPFAPDLMLPFKLSEDDARRMLADWQAYPEAPVHWRGVFLPLYSVLVEGRPGLASAAPEAEEQLPQSGHLRAAWTRAEPEPAQHNLLSEYDIIAPTLSPNEAIELHQTRLIADTIEDEGTDKATLKARKAILAAAPPSVTQPELIIVPVWIAALAGASQPLAVDGWSGAVAGGDPDKAGLFARMIDRFKR